MRRIRSLLGTGLANDLVERFVVADHAQIGSGTFFDSRLALIQILDFGHQRAIALLQTFVLSLLSGHFFTQTPDFAHAAVSQPKSVLEGQCNDDENRYEYAHDTYSIKAFRT